MFDDWVSVHAIGIEFGFVFISGSTFVLSVLFLLWLVKKFGFAIIGITSYQLNIYIARVNTKQSSPYQAERSFLVHLHIIILRWITEFSEIYVDTNFE